MAKSLILILWGPNHQFADDIILFATLEAELQELVDRLNRVSHKYSIFINVNNTKVITSDGIACHLLIQNVTSDGIACHLLIQNEQLEQVDMFPYLKSPITKDGERMTKFRTRLNRGQAIGASMQKIVTTYRF